MEGPAREAGALYILGDLFEHFWVGNDDRTPPIAAVLDILRAATAAELPVHIMRGNRDMLLDRGFEPLSGARILPDEWVVDLHGEPTLVMHGDLLCSRDWKYQAFRAVMSSAPVRPLFLRLPYRWRTGLSHGLRPAFRRSADAKPPQIIDVTQTAVERVMRRHGVVQLIHGHTHRPAVHAFKLDGRPARRVVLGDWYQDPLLLACRDGETRLMRVEEYLEL